MPKIIENVRDMLIEETKRQIKENGYEGVTIRSIARGCSLGLGTFYNYFKSKDMLIATFLLEDWNERITRVIDKSREESSPMDVIKNIHTELCGFMEKHKAIFTSAEAIKSFNNTVSGYHKILRNQIAEPIRMVCAAEGYENYDFLSQFVAESVLTWTVAKKSFDEIASIVSKLFVK